MVHQGVSPAARALDKEQPTLSRQINELEDSLRTRLYHRRPFGLTEKGETLFRAIEPFFRELPKLEAKVRGGDTIQIGASTIILADHLPAVEKIVRRQFPNSLVVRESNQPRLLQGLERGEIDSRHHAAAAELPQKIFAQTPPANSAGSPRAQSQPAPLRRPALETGRNPGESYLPHAGRTDLPRVSETLKQMEIDWRPHVEVGSLDLVQQSVQKGYGIGLAVRVPGSRLPPKLRALDLPDFPVLTLGMLWRDDQNKLLRAFASKSRRARARLPRNFAIVEVRQAVLCPLW